jgi:putative membrane protein
MSLPPARPYDQQQLAAVRTRLANERTLLTYVRTSLALVGFGLALLQLGPHRAHTLGLGAIGVAALFMLIGGLRFRARARQIETCRTPAT